MINNLKKWGLSEYEAKAYLALLSNPAVTAYEAAKSARIPTSKIYETLKKLQNKGMAIEVNQEGKAYYHPLPQEEFIKRSRTQVDKELEELEADLKTFQTQPSPEFVWNLRSYEEALDKAREFYQDAQQSILISGWEEDIKNLRPIIKEKEKLGIKVVTVHFGMLRESIGLNFYHPIEDTIYHEQGGRTFLTVIDSRKVLWGTFTDTGFDLATYSHNKGFVHLAEDYIKHDIYIMKIVKRFDKELIATFGEKYHLLRDIYQDKEK
ncbi:TrmB family transcriptional regulator [Spirochaeta cellobiosiphila]|uniref:TrmB family transcriptional regulator n=1 Tax=Spirochaeta cellobiosiphila TaxID=504483 RepID=UPI0003FC5B02|nr:helix-turn-helix domain-containing protein [Spirochaeta cellobiosiphila]